MYIFNNMRRLLQSEVIDKFKKIWNDRYDYSLVEYIDMKKKVNIICHKHGVFEIMPNNHINGQGCKKCSNECKSYSLEEYIEIANKKHNNFYNYSKVKYNTFNDEITIICPLHGEFTQIATNHLKHGCKICGGKDNRETFLEKCKNIWGDRYDYSNTYYKSSHDYIEYVCKDHGVVKQLAYSHLKSCCPKCSRVKYNNQDFIEKSISVHKDTYDYSLVSSVNGFNSLVDIICKKHGEFTQKVSNHLKGYGCKECHFDSMRIKSLEFIKRSKDIHHDRYNYDEINYINYTTKVKIFCKAHGYFLQTPSSHIRGNGCPVCRSSKGETKIFKLLTDNNIKFEKNYKFRECKFKNELPFDFYLPDFNICIEYDGELHFKEIKNFGGKNKLLDYQRNDQIKNDFCSINNIKLLRIKYTDFDKIEEILKHFLNINI